VNDFVILFSVIILVSVGSSGALLLIRRKGGGRWRRQEHIHAPGFRFFTTLYAFVIGFAIVTLWSAFLTPKTNVNREAESVIIVLRSAKHLPNSGPFCQAVTRYFKTGLPDFISPSTGGTGVPPVQMQARACGDLTLLLIASGSERT